MSIWKMNLWASVIIVTTVVLRSLALHRIPKNTFLILWGLALTRLLLTFQFHLTLPFKLPEIPLIASTPIINTQNNLTTQIENISQISTILPWTSLIWIIVVVGLTLYFVLSHLRYRRVYKLAIPVENDNVHEWQQLNVLKKRTVKIKVSTDISAPLTYGLLRPIILLPKTMDLENRAQLQYILTHEMIHIKRFDTLWKRLLMIAACIHWFNPFVWVMYILANRDLEITCDEKVVHTLGENSKKGYALTLIELAEEQAKMIPLGTAFSKNAIEERIISIMKIRKNKFSGLVISVGAILVLTLITLSFITNGNGAKVENVAETSDTTSLPENQVKDESSETSIMQNDDNEAIIGTVQNLENENHDLPTEDITIDDSNNIINSGINSDTQMRVHPITGEIAYPETKN